MNYNKVLDEIAKQGNDALFSALTGNTSIVLSEVLKTADDKEKQRLAWQIPGGAKANNKHFEELRKFILGEAGKPADDKKDENPGTPGKETGKDDKGGTPVTPGSETGSETGKDNKEVKPTDKSEDHPSEVDVETRA